LLVARSREMSHRKFSHPHCGHLGFRPFKRCRAVKPKISAMAYERQGATKTMQKPQFACFLGHKVGMTTVVVKKNRPELKKLHNKEVVEPVTYIETPPSIVVGVRGYVQTPTGYKCANTVFAQHLSTEFRRRMIKNWTKSNQRSFYHYSKLYENADTKKALDDKIAEIKQTCQKVKAIVHTQPQKIPKLGMKKGIIYEVPIVGGSVAEKVDFVVAKFEKEYKIDDMISENEIVDLAGVTKGKGHQGVVKRFGVKRLQKKTRRGRRKVACIGSWHPANIQDTVARHGQMGYHHRVIKNSKVFAIKNGADATAGTTAYDKTPKSINPLGGFRKYGLIRNQCVMLKGSVMGPSRRPILIKLSTGNVPKGDLSEKVDIKFIDTSSHTGNGRFQTATEKRATLGMLKKDLALEKQQQS